jgi:hypothetical protein
MWVFVANITKEFILGLDILRVYDASADLGRQTLLLAEEEVSLRKHGGEAPAFQPPIQKPIYSHSKL